jgi:uncharacterized protein YndB with AHSA1/START domain
VSLLEDHNNAPPELTLSFSTTLPASRELVFAAETEVTHVRHTIAPFGERVDVCEIDLRVGGEYHFVFTEEGHDPCSFRGEFLEVDAPRRVVATWIFDGWPEVLAVESKTLHDAGVHTVLEYRLTFADLASRGRMGLRGLEANYQNLSNYLASLQ